jgi:hypothetical protein
VDENLRAMGIADHMIQTSDSLFADDTGHLCRPVCIQLPGSAARSETDIGSFDRAIRRPNDLCGKILKLKCCNDRARLLHPRRGQSAKYT